MFPVLKKLCIIKIIRRKEDFCLHDIVDFCKFKDYYFTVMGVNYGKENRCSFVWLRGV